MVDISKVEIFTAVRANVTPGQGIAVGDLYVQLEKLAPTLKVVDQSVISLLGIIASAGPSSVGRIPLLNAAGKLDSSFTVPTTPVTLTNETAVLPNSRQLTAGINTVLDIATPGQVQVETVVPYTSPLQLIVLGGGISLAHLLGVRPKLAWWEFQCITAQAAYVAGDIIEFPAITAKTGITSAGPFVSIRPTTTTLEVRFSTVAPGALNSTTGAFTTLTPVNWQVRFHAQI